MPYRILVAFIVGFWLVMSALLIRLEVQPEKSNLLEVPVSHVLKLMFVQGQPSNLHILDGGQHIGGLSIRPGISQDKSLRSLAFSGNLSLRLPLVERQRITWDGALGLNRAFEMNRLHLTVAFRESGYTADVSIDPGANRLKYKISLAGSDIMDSSLPLDGSGANLGLIKLGIDPNVLANLTSNMTVPTMTAKQSELKIRNEKIDAYLVKVWQGDSVVADIYVSQLGQILLVKTPFGLTLSADDISF